MLTTRRQKTSVSCSKTEACSKLICIHITSCTNRLSKILFRQHYSSLMIIIGKRFTDNCCYYGKSNSSCCVVLWKIMWSWCSALKSYFTQRRKYALEKTYVTENTRLWLNYHRLGFYQHHRSELQETEVQFSR